MIYILTAAWVLVAALKWSGLAIALAGVSIFGWYFIRANARAARKDSADVTVVAWGGAAARSGIKILVLGIMVQVVGFLLAMALPGRM